MIMPIIYNQSVYNMMTIIHIRHVNICQRTSYNSHVYSKVSSELAVLKVFMFYWSLVYMQTIVVI